MNRPRPPEGLIDLKMAGRQFKVSPRALWRLARLEVLPCQRFNHQVYVRVEDVATVLATSGRRLRRVAA